jgi:hypothetical protein
MISGGFESGLPLQMLIDSPPSRNPPFHAHVLAKFAQRL